MEKRTCKQCGKEFELSDGETHFYEQKKLELPKRCASCRKSNKTQDSATMKNRNIGAKETIYGILAIIIALFLYVYTGNTSFFNDNTQNSSTYFENDISYTFRNEQLLYEHFQKHGSEFNYKTQKEYEIGANRVINDKKSLHKKESEDGDDVYYLESTNEIVFVSADGYIRTYFKPNDGAEYYNKQ